MWRCWLGVKPSIRRRKRSHRGIRHSQGTRQEMLVASVCCFCQCKPWLRGRFRSKGEQ
jgi:hypothetical protein